MRNHKYPQNIIAQLNAEIRELKQIIRQLENVQVSTVPIYDVSGYLTADAVEGQMVIDTITTPGTPIFKFYQNGAWHQP